MQLPLFITVCAVTLSGVMSQKTSPATVTTVIPLPTELSSLFNTFSQAGVGTDGRTTYVAQLATATDGETITEILTYALGSTDWFAGVEAHDSTLALGGDVLSCDYVNGGATAGAVGLCVDIDSSGLDGSAFTSTYAETLAAHSIVLALGPTSLPLTSSTAVSSIISSPYSTASPTASPVLPTQTQPVSSSGSGPTPSSGASVSRQAAATVSGAGIAAAAGVGGLLLLACTVLGVWCIRRRRRRERIRNSVFAECLDEDDTEKGAFHAPNQDGHELLANPWSAITVLEGNSASVTTKPTTAAAASEPADLVNIRLLSRSSEGSYALAAGSSHASTTGEEPDVTRTAAASDFEASESSTVKYAPPLASDRARTQQGRVFTKLERERMRDREHALSAQSDADPKSTARLEGSSGQGSGSSQSAGPGSSGGNVENEVDLLRRQVQQLSQLVAEREAVSDFEGPPAYDAGN